MKNEMLNEILLIINLVTVYMLCLAGKGMPGNRPAESGCPHREILWRKAGWMLEFTVYGAGMIRLADLIIQGIAGPGSGNRALFAVRIMLAESMLYLFPLWKILYSGRGRRRDENAPYSVIYWNRDEENYGIYQNGSRKDQGAHQSGKDRRYMERAVCGEGFGIRINPEFMLGLFMLLGMTLRTWRETEPVKAFMLQTGYLLLFIGFEYLNERRSRQESVGGYLWPVRRCVDGESFPVKRYENGITGFYYGQEAAMEGLQHRRQEEYLKNVEQQYQRTRELWHDLKNHIKILEILAGEERFEELTDYLDSFQRDVERRMIPTKTGCAVVDALLGDKLYQAGKQGTKMSLQLCNLSEMRLQAVDLCVILGNLLDNAIEACARIPEEGCIRLRLRQEEDFYYLRVVNTAGEPVKKGQGYISGKRNRDNGVGHGLGLRSAERLAHQYGGSLITDYSDGEFTVVVRLRALQ